MHFVQSKIAFNGCVFPLLETISTENYKYRWSELFPLERSAFSDSGFFTESSKINTKIINGGR